MPAAISAAEVLARLPKALLSHESAARLLQIELVDDEGTERVTVPRNQSRVVVPGWKVVRADVPVSQQVRIGDLPATNTVRTVLDLGRVLKAEIAVAAGDSALRSFQCTLAALEQAARGRRGLAELVGRFDPLSGSVLESLLRVLLLDSDLPRFTTQEPIRDLDGKVVARVDFCWAAQRLVVEADGFAFHSKREDYRRDRERMNALERLGWRVLRFTWEDVRSSPETVIALIRSCLTLAA